MKIRLYLFVGLAVISCASIKEADLQTAEKSLPEPSLISISDSVRIRQIKSAIQSSPEALLSNSIAYEDGLWSLSLSREGADSLGVPENLYQHYLEKLESLNHPKK